MARETLGDLLINIRGDTQQLIKSFNSAENTVKKTSANIVKSIAGITASFVALDSVTARVQRIVQTGLNFEALEQKVKFSSATLDEFSSNLDFISDEADRLGINLLSAGNGFAKFSAGAKGTSLTLEDQKNVFLGVSEASVALRLTNEQTQASFTALEQIISKGKVQAEELRGQLGERIPGAFQIAARAMGVTTEELNKMLERGEVISEDFLPKFAIELRKTFGESAKEGAESARAAFNRLDNAILKLENTIAKSGLVDFFADVADSVSTAIGAFDKIEDKSLRGLQKRAEDLAEEIASITRDLNNEVRTDSFLNTVADLFDNATDSALGFRDVQDQTKFNNLIIEYKKVVSAIEEITQKNEENAKAQKENEEANKKTLKDQLVSVYEFEKAIEDVENIEKRNLELRKEQAQQLKLIKDLAREASEYDFTNDDSPLNISDFEITFDDIISDTFNNEFSENIEQSLYYGFYDFANGGSFRNILRSIGNDVGNAVGSSISKSLGSGAIGAIGGGIGGGLISAGISKIFSGSGFDSQKEANSQLEKINKELELQTKTLKESFLTDGAIFEKEIDFLTEKINSINTDIVKKTNEINSIFGGFSEDIDLVLASDKTLRVNEKIKIGLQEQLNKKLEESEFLTEKNIRVIEDLFLSEEQLIKKSLELSGSTKEIPRNYEELLTVIEDLKQSNGILTDSETSLIQQLKERIDTNTKLKESELDLTEARSTVSNSLERQINQQIALFNAYEDTQTSIQGTIREITNTKISIEEITEAIKNISSPEEANKTLGLINTYFQEQKDIARETIDIEKETLKKRIDLLEIEEDVLRSFSDFAFNIRTSQLESSLQTTALKEKFDLALEETKEAILQGDPDVQLLGDRVLNFGEAYLSSLKDTAKTSEELEFEQKRTALLLESFTGTGDNATILDLKNELISLSDDSSEDLKIQEQVESLLVQLNQETQNQQDIIETNILSLQSDIRSYLDSDSPLVEAVKSITEELKSGSWLSEISSSITQNQKDFNDAINKISQGEKKLIDGIEVTIVDGVPTATVTGATKPTIVEPIEGGSSSGSKIFSQPVKSITGQTINTSTTPSQTSGISLATTSGFSSLSEVYKSVLGRDVDPSGAKSWGNAISSGKLTLSEAASAISKSLEAQKKGVIPFAKGGYVKGGHGGVLGLVGEGEHDELITPLKDDPLNIGEVASKIDKMGNILLRLQSTNERLLTATLDIAGTNADIALEMSN